MFKSTLVEFIFITLGLIVIIIIYFITIEIRFVLISVKYTNFQISRMKWISSLAKSTEDFLLHVGHQSDIFLVVSIR